MTQAGELRESIAFEQRAVSSDGYGNSQGDFAEEFIVAGRIRPRLGGEAVMAAKLAGRNPVNIIVRYSSQTAQVTTEWRCRDTRTSETYNIRSIVNPDERHRFLEMLCEKGVAT